MDDVLSDKDLVGHTDNLVLSVTVEENDIIDIRAVAYILVFLHTCSDETILTVDIQFLISLCHLGSLDRIEVAYLRKTRMLCSVFVFQVLEPLHGYLYHVRQLLVNILDLRFQASNELVGLVFIEFQDALHLDLHQSEDILFGYLTDHLRVVRGESLIHIFTGSIHIGSILEGLAFIDPFFDEDLFQRTEVQLF